MAKCGSRGGGIGSGGSWWWWRSCGGGCGGANSPGLTLADGPIAVLTGEGCGDVGHGRVVQMTGQIEQMRKFTESGAG
jgi:hypothetical protein